MISGCAALTGISSDYPKYWPELAKQDPTCPKLAGRFVNEGSFSYLFNQKANSLIDRLGGIEAAVVAIHSSPGALTVAAERPDGQTRELVLTTGAGDFACVDGTVVLKPIVAWADSGTGGYRAERRLALRMATNGDLIGEDRVFSMGAVLWLVPIAGSQTFWYHWEVARK